MKCVSFIPKQISYFMRRFITTTKNSEIIKDYKISK